MANCNDLESQLKAIDAELAALESTERGLIATAELADPQPKVKKKVLRTLSGEEIGVDPGEWVTQAEMDAMKMGDETVRQMVQAGFTQKRGPSGRTGRMVNYAQLDPSKENLAALLEVMGLKFSDSPKGVELKRPFTSQVASRALLSLAQEVGADPRAAAKALASRAKGIDNLPSAVYAVAKARWDSATQYADVLDELADAIEGGYLTPELERQAGSAARWAHYYSQLDSQVRRRVGQALKSLQYKVDTEINLIDLADDIQDLTLDDIKGNSLAGDMLKLTAEGNAAELRRRAAAKRLSQMNGGDVNEGGFMADLRILNTFRRANLLSSLSTWVVRNPASGALVQGVYMAEDSVSGSLRLVAKNGLKQGAADGLKAASYAARAFNSAWGTAWGNASESLRTGKGTMGNENLKFVTAGVNESAKEFVETALTTSWDQLTSWKGVANPVNLLNVINASVWKVFGGVGEKLTGTDAGYLAPFRLLNAGDEFMRTQAYAWKTNHEAFIQAAEEGRAAGKSVEWIEQRADELAKKTIFDGVFTDDDLAEFRKTRNQEYGIPIGEEIGDDELRAMLYNQYKNAPNLNSDISRIGQARTDDVTFTGKLNDPITQGVNQMRSNPLMGWAIPFWKVPINGIGWVLNRDMWVALPKQLLMEGRQASSGGTKFTVEEMANARARTMVATAIGATTHMLWENGLFTDGGSFDPRQRERERRNWLPYSFSLGSSIAAGAVKVRGNGIDVIDLMGLQADIARAWHEGLIGEQDAASATKKVVLSYANLLKNKAALKNITSILNWAQDPDRYDVSRVLGDQMGGVMPLSGFFGHGTRALSDPGERIAQRRTPTADEMAALNKDPLMGPLQPVIDLLQSAFIASQSTYPLLGALQPREKDWLGNSIDRPLGLPVDQTIPFMPVLKPQDRLYRWLEKHGFGDKPRPDGQFEMGGATVQMTNEEEDFYRETMRTKQGDIPPEELGLGAGRLMPIWQFVEGRDMQSALRELMNDEQYNALLSNPAGSVSPSLVAQPGKSLSKRTKGSGSELYAPIDDIIKYYDHLALTRLLGNPQFNVGERYQAVIKSRVDGVKAYAAEVSATGTLMP